MKPNMRKENYTPNYISKSQEHLSLLFPGTLYLIILLNKFFNINTERTTPVKHIPQPKSSNCQAERLTVSNSLNSDKTANDI